MSNQTTAPPNPDSALAFRSAPVCRQVTLKNHRFFSRTERLFEKLLEGDRYQFCLQDEEGRGVYSKYTGKEHVIFYDKEHIGRGVHFILESDLTVRLRLFEPATSYDIDLFYDLAWRVARYYKTNGPEEVERQKKETYEECIRLLSSYADKDVRVVVFSGAKLPIWMKTEELVSYGSIGRFSDFATFLHEKQSGEKWYSVPITGDATGEEEGGVRFVIVDKASNIIPEGQEYKNVRKYLVYLCVEAEKQTLMYADYSEFLNSLPAGYKQRFDASHWILSPMDEAFIVSRMKPWDLNP
ncbi:MAG: hypothetical protein IJV01_06580 [Bacteroidales bacterium]|nr:hypothetical protein [Bacteroidales bacterium]